MDIQSLSRKERRAAARHAREQKKRFGDNLSALPLDEWRHLALKSTVPVLSVWRSKQFLVQVYDESKYIGGLVRLSVCRTDIDSHGDWADKITWDQLQGLKKQVGMGDFDAIEAFPKDSDVVNVANLRHLWVFTKGSPLNFFWRKKENR